MQKSPPCYECAVSESPPVYEDVILLKDFYTCTHNDDDIDDVSYENVRIHKSKLNNSFIIIILIFSEL